MSVRQPRREIHENLIRYGSELFDTEIVSANGSVVVDAKGRRILDFTSGQMCATIGHSHPAVVQAIQKSAQTAVHLFSGMIPESVTKLAQRMQEWLPHPLRKSMFVSTGSESNEAAIRMAKLHTGGFEVLALGGSWHGVTGASSSASFASDRKGYGPTIPGMSVLPEPNSFRCPVRHCRNTCDMTCLDVGLQLFDMASTGNTAAVIAEPILSAGGVIVPPKDYFKRLKKEAHRRGMLMIFDEAQTAFGRIAHRSGAEYFDTVPDIITLSKTLGGGLPLAAVVTSDEIEESTFRKGFNFYTSHVSDPLPAEAGLAVLDVIAQDKLVERAQHMGDYLKQGLLRLTDQFEEIGDVRGEGLLLGIELVKDRQTREPYHELGAITTKRCLELGLSMNIRRRPERGSVWRIAPPLTVTFQEIDQALEILQQALTECLDTLSRRK